MLIEIKQSHIDLLKNLSLQGTKLTGLKYNWGEGDDEEFNAEQDLKETLHAAGLIYPLIEDSETGKRAFHLTMVGREVLKNLVCGYDKTIIELSRQRFFTTRVSLALQGAKLKTLGEVSEYGRLRLSCLRNISTVSLNQIHWVLKNEGLELKP